MGVMGVVAARSGGDLRGDRRRAKWGGRSMAWTCMSVCREAASICWYPAGVTLCGSCSGNGLLSVACMGGLDPGSTFVTPSENTIPPSRPSNLAIRWI